MIVSSSITAGSMLSGKAPADAAAAAGLDKVILRAGVEGVLPVDELGVQDDVALLRRARLQIGQPLPALEVLRAGNPGLATALLKSPGGALGSLRSVQNSP